MKTIRYAVLLAAVIFVVALWMLRPDEVITAPLAETKPAETQPLQPQVTKQDILKLFHDYNDREPDSKQALDCAVVTDFAYGLLGVVLYTTEDYEGCSLDFFNKDGICIGKMGIGSAPSEDVQLTYLGDGAFSCQLIHTDGNDYLCKIFYVINEEGTYFRVEE